jgi:hypothetical protein
MSDVVIPDFLFILLILGFWLSSTFFIGRAIKDEPATPQNLRLVFYHFDIGDWFQFALGIILLIATVYFLNTALTGAASVNILPMSDEKIRFMGLFTSFIALGLSMFVISVNQLKEVYSTVINRVRFDKIDDRFDDLEDVLRDIRKF